LEEYLKLRKLTKDDVEKGDCLIFPSDFDDIKVRDNYYKSLSFRG